MLVSKSDFVGLEGVIHLAAGGETPMLRRHANAFEQFCASKALGLDSHKHFNATRARVQQHLAELLHMHAEDIALTGNSSAGIAQVVSAIDWQAGDNVVVGEYEFPSGLFGLARLQALGVELRVIKSPNYYLNIDDLIAACDQRTRLVYVSYVSYYTGQRVDLERLSAGVHRTPAMLLLDATHALGVVPVDGDLCDFVVCSGYKWLLATHQGILAWNRRRQPHFEPLGVGWRSANPDTEQVYRLHASAMRAELGNPNHLDVCILEQALLYLKGVGIDRIAANALRLGGRVRAALVDLGLEVITPEPEAERAGNICFVHPQAEQIARLGLRHGMQLWGSEGRMRISIHLYTDDADIDAFLAVLPALVEEASHVSEETRP
ncbi:MAG: aminotransferase class V-fold PLP-dependent enzyme [Roseiflexaceae bacterium]